jgi:hypothetical protein
MSDRLTREELHRRIAEVNALPPEADTAWDQTALETRQQAGIRLALEVLGELVQRVEDLERRVDARGF